MHLNPDDPRITAHALGELSPEESSAVEAAAATDPVIQAKIQETREIQHFLKQRLTTPTAQLLPRQRENIRRAARMGGSYRWRTSLPWAITGAAALLTLAAFLFMREPAGKTKEAAETPTKPTSPSASQTAPPPPTPSVPERVSAITDRSTLRLPILSGGPKLPAITQSIMEDGKLPPHESVRPEEILNSFPLRLQGTAAIARGGNAPWHPDNRDSGMSAHVATLTTETIACPWKPSATLLLISVRSNSRKDSDVKISFRPDPANVSNFRLLGFPTRNESPSAHPPTLLTAGSHSTLAIQIESSKPGSALGTLDWSADDKPAPSISLLHKLDAAPSDDARFASLVCTWSLWLAEAAPGNTDRETISALARENTSTELPPERADFIRMIAKSLQL